MDDLLKEVLFKHYGYENFRKPQDEIIKNILNKNDTVAILPTGAGKSLTFQIPALIFPNLTIVVSPLISLMTDQVITLQKRKIEAYFLNSTLSSFETKQIYDKIINNKVKLLYLSPEKLENEIVLKILKQIKIDFICIDEAHTMLWGLDFREAFLNVKKFINSLKERPVISAVSATATPNSINEIIKLLTMNNPKIFKTSFDRPNLYYEVVKVKDKIDYIVNYIKKYPEKCGIIYTNTCKNVMELYQKLYTHNFSVTYYHGQLRSEEKQINQELFLTEKKKIIIATISFGMGIDKSNIRFVINYDMPMSIEDLVQMKGRGSRDGQLAECFLLYNYNDLSINEYFINSIDKKKKNVVNFKSKQLKDIFKYCHTNKCLHKYISNYFGEKIKNCNNCHNCKKKKYRV